MDNDKKTSDNCEIFCYDEAKVIRGQQKLHNIDVQHIAQLFKVLGDETRLKVAYTLCEEEELCVCDVANITGVTMATASHHLRLLRNMGIVKYRKEGKLVFYSLHDEQMKLYIRLATQEQKEVVRVE